MIESISVYISKADLSYRITPEMDNIYMARLQHYDEQRHQGYPPAIFLYKTDEGWKSDCEQDELVQQLGSEVDKRS